MGNGSRRPRQFGSTLGLAVTGIAGPGGGMPGKPVGLTFIAGADEADDRVERHVWQGDRIQNKEQSTRKPP